MERKTYNVIGLMSGTSLDGLDIAFCKFQLLPDQKWEWKICHGATVSYPAELISKLKASQSLSAYDLLVLDADLGKWMGEAIKDFLTKNELKIDFIASHGHTVFHEPEKQLGLQIGNPNFIHAITQCPVISDFRSLDIAKGGQGAPLVPIGDALLFQEYEFCINLGGIANVSYEGEGSGRIAYDICACNILLNSLANLKGLAFDDQGGIAKSGIVIDKLLEAWEAFSFLHKKPPKSLGIEQIEPEILARIDLSTYSLEDMMATAVEHISNQICKTISSAKKSGKVLLTGGGAFNNFLVDRIQSKLEKEYELEKADEKLVNYKEALVFAFLGVLNVRNEYNTLASVTGAPSNSVSGQKLGDI